MKKLLILLFITIATRNYGQITLEHTYPPPHSNYEFLRLVKLSSSGYKYVVYDTSVIALYNLNHTLYKTINIPPSSAGFGNALNFEVSYVSEELFNTSPTDIEYFLYYPGTTNIGHCRVYDELGNVLFSQDSTQLNLTFGDYGYQNFISYSSVGYKMIIYNSHSAQAYVYSLPGSFPCSDCSNGTTSSKINVNETPKGGDIFNYPNPSSEQTTVEYHLPQNVTTADLVFYTITGQEIKRFKVTNAFHNILISTTDLDAGTYYYQIQTATSSSAGKKMIVIK